MVAARTSKPKRDITGQRFGLVVVLEFAGFKRYPNATKTDYLGRQKPNPVRHPLWRVQCDCGVERVVFQTDLVRKGYKSHVACKRQSCVRTAIVLKTG